MNKKTKVDTNKNVNELKKQLLNFRLTQAVSGPIKSHEKKNLKKEIARILTSKNKYGVG
jgi:ribosomal protein L29